MIGDEPEDGVPGSGDRLFYFKSYQKIREREREKGTISKKNFNQKIISSKKDCK